MESFKKIDGELYRSKYGNPRVGSSIKIWNDIKSNFELLNWAIQPTRDKFDERDTVNGLAICDSILIDYNHVDQDIYHRLIDLIYSNQQIARIVVDGYSNGGYSFLLMALMNPNIKLSDEQKAFAVHEAMNKIGTVRSQQESNHYSQLLDQMGITDEKTTLIDIDGSINPIGEKAKQEYFHSMFQSLSDTQAHGSGDFDIRYWILKNPNWSLDEKKKLIMDFWYDDDTYDETLEQWEWGIVNDLANFRVNSSTLLDKAELYEYSYDMLLSLYGNKDMTDGIWNEIQFCRQMHQLRPQQWELDDDESKVYEKVVASS